jgi:serine/threonine protein kinase
LGSFTEDEIDHELQIIAQLCTTRHEHIVSVLRYGWFVTNESRCFIDMELCDINLQDYIDRRVTADQEACVVQDPVFVSVDCAPSLRLMNTWTIMSHIARGLKFIHEKHLTHRDLKPANGNALN